MLNLVSISTIFRGGKRKDFSHLVVVTQCTLMYFGHFHSSLLFEEKFSCFCVDLKGKISSFWAPAPAPRRAELRFSSSLQPQIYVSSNSNVVNNRYLICAIYHYQISIEMFYSQIKYFKALFHLKL